MQTKQILSKKWVFLQSFGHCGIDWMHSLIMGHPQALSLPTFSFYRNWKLFECEKVNNAFSMHKIWSDFILLDPSMQCDESLFFETDSERGQFNHDLLRNIENSNLSRKEVFLAIHLAFISAKKLDLNSYRTIFVHEHTCFPWRDFTNDFNDNLSILLLLRDPRAAVAGYFRGFDRKFPEKPDFYDYYYNKVVEEWLQAYDLWKAKSNKLKERLKIVKYEDMCSDLETVMKDVSNLLSIDYTAALLNGTYFNGSPTSIDSCYLSRDNNKSVEENFFSPENQKKRWKSVISSPEEIKLFEFLFRDLMTEFNYEPLYPATKIDDLFSLINFILPHRGQDRLSKSYKGTDAEFKRFTQNKVFKLPLLKKLWPYFPTPLKMTFIVLHSSSKRARILFFPGDRWKDYDTPNSAY